MKCILIFIGELIVSAAILYACTAETKPVVKATPTLANNSAVGTVPAGNIVTGKVVDTNGKLIVGATVRVQGTLNATTTDDEGGFLLQGLVEQQSVTISAWKDTYYCDKVETVKPPVSDIRLVLRKVQTNDNSNYQWIPPVGDNSCYSCKPGVTQVWLDNDAHGKSATNIRFLTMYNGTDVNGNQSPLTRYGYSRDYGRVPLLPDLSKPYYGPGYKLDFLDNTGNCAACHIPGAAVDAPYAIDPNTVNGVNKFGVHCDYCHKVADVRLNPTTGLPYPNMPGVLSQDIRRPFPEDKERYSIFFGTFDDDNVPMEDTYLPLIKESQWCAPCHFGVFWDTVVYNSFGEWLSSPYSNPQTGKTCQQCHMPSPTILNGKLLTNVAPGKGGVERDPQTLFAHTFPGASSVDLLQNAVSLEVSTSRQEERLTVTVTIINDKTGHDVPTDSPLRQMILLIKANDSNGRTLPLLEGGIVPEWGGAGDSSKGYYAGLPGKGFAKILSELWTEASPTGAYWNPTRLVSDNRIPVFGSDTSTYVFKSAGSDSVKVKVTLLYRRAFKELSDQKGWNLSDILMAEQTVEAQ